MRQLMALVALAAGVIPSVLALNGGPNFAVSLVCGFALLGTALFLGSPDSEIAQLKVSRDGLQGKLDTQASEVSKLQTQIKEKQSATEAQEKRTKEAETKLNSALDQVKLEAAKYSALSDQLNKALEAIQKIEAETKAVTEAVTALKAAPAAPAAPKTNDELQQVESQIGQFKEGQSISNQQLEQLVENLNSNLEILTSQNLELSGLNNKLVELRSRSTNGDFAQEFSVVVANLALKGARSAEETEAANCLQILNQRLKNRDEMLRALASGAEQQTTQLAMRSESSLKAIRTRLEEAKALQVESSKFFDQLSGLSSSLEKFKSASATTDTSARPLPATDQLQASVEELSELSKTWKSTKWGA